MQSQLIYLANLAIPSRATHAMQVMRMCTAFKSIGFDVTLAHLDFEAETPEGYTGDVWSFYGIKERFTIKRLGQLEWKLLARFEWIQKILRLLPWILFAWHCHGNNERPFVCYGRSKMGVWAMLWIQKLRLRPSLCQGIYWELHDFPRSQMEINLLSKVSGLIVISEALRRDLIKIVPEIQGRIWVEPDGVAMELIQSGREQYINARQSLGLSDEDKVVVYTGRAIKGKGVEVLIDAADYLKESGVKIIIVGKVYHPEYLEKAKRKSNVSFVGFIPPAHVSFYAAIADFFVIPTTPDLPYAAYTSPLKMFEYMAYGKPVLASNLPVIREILQHEYNALLFEPGDAKSLAQAIIRLLSAPKLAEKLGKSACHDVQKYTWVCRAQRIVEKFSNESASLSRYGSF